MRFLTSTKKINEKEGKHVEMSSTPPSGQNRRKTVCRSVFLTTWHCILSAQTAFLAILPTQNILNEIERWRWNGRRQQNMCIIVLKVQSQI